MSIEAKIEELTAALKENTVALRDVLAASASKTTPTEEEPKPAKKKAKAKKEEPEPTPEPAEEETPEKDEPVAEEPAAKDEPTADELVAEITETVKNAITAPGADPAQVKKSWMAVREGYGVEKMSDLTDIEQLKDALEKAKAL